MLKTKHIDNAIAALSTTLTGDEAAGLDAFPPRPDYQDVSDPAVLRKQQPGPKYPAPDNMETKPTTGQLA